MKKYLALSLSDVVFIMLMNVKMPTIVVGILIFMSRVNFMLSSKKFYNLGARSHLGNIWEKENINPQAIVYKTDLYIWDNFWKGNPQFF